MTIEIHNAKDVDWMEITENIVTYNLAALNQGKEIVMSEHIPLKIMIVGRGAEKIFNSAFVKELINDGHVITVDNTESDLVIGTTAVRTYENTVHYLKTIVKKIIQDKNSWAEPKAPKKTPSKKKNADVIVFEATPVELKSLVVANNVYTDTTVNLEVKDATPKEA